MDFERFKWVYVFLMAIGALFWPFWLTVILFILGVLVFEKFYAGLIILFLMDVIYGFETLHVGPLYGVVTIGGIFVYLILRIIKERTIIFKGNF